MGSAVIRQDNFHLPQVKLELVKISKIFEDTELTAFVLLKVHQNVDGVFPFLNVTLSSHQLKSTPHQLSCPLGIPVINKPAV